MNLLKTKKQQRMPDSEKQIYFIEGEISPMLIAETIEKQNSDFNIGAHSMFIGQVRNDCINEKEVAAIDYSCYESMAADVLEQLIAGINNQFQLSCVKVYHSLGRVAAGKICLFVFVASKHRRNAIDGCSELVERIKKELPVWGKEIFEDENYEWKKNS